MMSDSPLFGIRSVVFKRTSLSISSVDLFCVWSWLPDVIWNFRGSLISQIVKFLCVAGTNFREFGFHTLQLETNFVDLGQQHEQQPFYYILFLMDGVNAASQTRPLRMDTAETVRYVINKKVVMLFAVKSK